MVCILLLALVVGFSAALELRNRKMDEHLERLGIANCLTPSTAPGAHGTIGSQPAHSWLKYHPPRPLPEDTWLKLAPIEVASRAPKLALMINVPDTLYNNNLWRAWLEQAEKEGYDVPVVVNTYAMENFHLPETMEKYVMQNHTKAGWGNQKEAMFNMAKEAFKDPEVTHVTSVAHNSIPIRSYASMLMELAKDPATRMCADDTWIYPRAATWWVMTKEQFNLLFEQQPGWGNFQGDMFDEQAYYLPLRQRMHRYPKSSQDRVLNECTTYEDWSLTPRPCKFWATKADKCQCPTMKTKEESLWEDADKAHPATFHRLPETGFQEMHASGYWFARKFGKGVANYKSLIDTAQKLWNADL